MLLPALNNAREAARSSNCKNNLKQLGLIAAQYTIDYDDYNLGFVLWSGNVRTDATARWHEHLIKEQIVSSTLEAVPNETYSAYFSKQLNCPSNPHPKISWNMLPDQLGYSFNYYIGSQREGNGSGIYPQEEFQWKKVTQRNRFLSRTTLWADKWKYYSINNADMIVPASNGLDVHYTKDKASIGAYKAHSGGTNSVYADGHVDTVDYILINKNSSTVNIWNATVESDLVESR